MGTRLFHAVLVAAVSVLGLLIPWVQADEWVGLLDAVLRSAALWRLSAVEQGVIHRLAELAVHAVAGAMLGGAQVYALRRAGLQVAGWVGMTAMAVPVGLVGSRALAVALGLSPTLAPVGMGVALGLTQAWLLRREVHGAAVWVVACGVGYGMGGLAADWKEQTWRAAVEMGATWRLASISITAQAVTWGALALCMAIGGAFLLANVRAQVLTASGSRMPGALGQFAVLGLALPLMVALEARAKSPRPWAPPPNPPTRMEPRPTRTWGTHRTGWRPATPGEPPAPGCASRGCGPAMTQGGDSRPPSGRSVTDPAPRPAPILHDEYLRVLTGSGRARAPTGEGRWNQAPSSLGQEPANPSPDAAPAASTAVVP